MPTLTHKRLKELLDYDEATGVFTWRVRRNAQRPAGSVAGTVCKRGYRRINIEKNMVLAHRLAVFYVTGFWPQSHIDHRHGQRDDNRVSELRDLPQAVNNQNIVRPHCDNKTGFLGVVPAPGNKFDSHICTRGKRKYLGRFETAEQAHSAYVQAKRQLHEGCTI